MYFKKLTRVSLITLSILFLIFIGLYCKASLNDPLDPKSEANNYVGDVNAYDKTAPEILYATIYDSTISYNDTITLMGTVYDTNYTGLSITINARAVDLDYPAWKVTIPLKKGKNTVVVKAVDGSINKNILFDTLTITRITTPAPASNVVLELEGKAIKVTWDDNSSNETKFIVQRSTDDKDFKKIATVDSNKTEYTDEYSFVALQAYYYRVIAVNEIGESKPSASNVKSYPAIISTDLIGPTIIFENPKNNDTVNTESQNIYLTVSDTSGVKSVTINNINASISGGNWNAQVALVEGQNTIYVVATDNSPKANLTKDSISIVYDPDAEDNTPPVINFESPKDNDTVSTASKTITVTATDNSGVLWVKLNGTAMTYLSGNYSGKATLLQGNNIIVLVASDTKGNTQTDTLHIVYSQSVEDNTPPTIAITRPTEQSIVTDDSVWVEGVATDNSDISSIKVNGAEASFIAPNWSRFVSLSHGLNTIVVEAIDASSNGNCTTDSVRVIKDNAPKFKSKADTSIVVGSNYSTTINAIDPDGDVLTYEFISVPTLGFPTITGDNKSATIGGYIPSNTGVDTFCVKVTDSWNASDTLTWYVHVNTPTQQNQAPYFTTDASNISSTIQVGENYTAELKAQDPESDELYFTLLDMPVGMEIGTRDGKITWKPTMIQDTGIVSVKVEVSDGELSDTIKFRITVTQPNRAPFFENAVNNVVGIENQVIQFSLTANDSDNNNLTFYMSSEPTGAILDGSDFTWTPTYSQSGNYEITFVVEDDGSPKLSDTTSIIIVVDDALSPAPVANAGSDTSVDVNTVIKLHGSGSSDETGITEYAWKCGNEDWFTVSNGDTSVVAPSTEQTMICSLKVSDEDGNISYDAVLVTVRSRITLQQGVDGYTGCSDMYVISDGGGVNPRPANDEACGTHPRLLLGIKGG